MISGEGRTVGLRSIDILVLGVVLTAVLISVGLWRWQRSREEARAVRCQSIMAQYGRAFATYATSYGGVLPYEGVGREAEGHVVWFDALEPYMAESEQVCPSVDPQVDNHQKGYRINSQLARSGSEAPSEWYRRLDSIDQPAHTVVLFDAKYGGKKLSMKGKLKDVHYRHNGSANVLFADWHVQRFGENELREASNWLPPKVVWSPVPDRTAE